jgi:hypothetical protein
MKRILASSLVILLLVPYCLKIGVWAWYFQNQDYIATTLCENRDKPEMECNGSCVLNKALQKADCCAVDDMAGNESPEAPVLPLKKALDAFGFDYTPVSAALLVPLTPNDIYSTQKGYTCRPLAQRLVVSGVFHPPC